MSKMQKKNHYSHRKAKPSILCQDFLRFFTKLGKKITFIMKHNIENIEKYRELEYRETVYSQSLQNYMRTFFSEYKKW